MKHLFWLALLLNVQIAHAQKPIAGKAGMERFNISQFRTMAKDDEYVRVLDDGTTIDQMKIRSGFVEKITKPGSLYYDYREFYPDGQLQAKGQYFIRGDFKAGVWIECSESGAVTSQIDYDKPYRLRVEDVLRILEEEKIPFSLKRSTSRITRDAVKGKATWFVEFLGAPGELHFLKIDDATAKIYDRGMEKFKSRR